MRWLRSWPAETPPGRAHVIDELPRLVIRDYDYRSALYGVQDDVLLLEWDVAMGADDMAAFAERAEQKPDEVLVAPYKLYPAGSAPVWVHRVRIGEHRTRFVHSHEQLCDYFGLGCVYLPYALIAEFIRENGDSPLNDLTFSAWHYRTHGPVAIDWSLHPAHLHS